MIDDLLTELVVEAVDRLLSPDTPREESDFGLARLNARLSPPIQREGMKAELESPTGFDPQLESRLLNHYVQLRVDDLQQIAPRVHEWVLDRLSYAPAKLNTNIPETLRTLYFLFPESTVRHSVVGLLVQADQQGEWSDRSPRRSPVATLSEAIDEDAGTSPEDRVDQIRVLMDLLLDYIDLLPDATERALTELYHTHPEENLTAHLLEWSNRLGGERASRIRRALERPTDRRE